MSPLENLGFILGTSFASGLNLYATMAVAGDAFGERRKALRIARKQLGIVQFRLIGGDFAFQALDFARQAVKIALVLVGKLPCRGLADPVL